MNRRTKSHLLCTGAVAGHAPLENRGPNGEAPAGDRGLETSRIDGSPSNLPRVLLGNKF